MLGLETNMKVLTQVTNWLGHPETHQGASKIDCRLQQINRDKSCKVGIETDTVAVQPGLKALLSYQRSRQSK